MMMAKIEELTQLVSVQSLNELLNIQRDSKETGHYLINNQELIAIQNEFGIEICILITCTI